jgi:hypothetical protein
MPAKRIIEQGKINQLHKYFDKYEYDDKILIEDMVIDHMLLYKNNLIKLEGSIPQDLYNRLEIIKQRAIEEDEKIRIRTIESMKTMVSNVEYTRILNAIKPLLRSKTRLMKIMDKNYDKISEETSKVVEKFLIEKFPIPPKETQVEPAPTMEPPKKTKIEEEERIDQFFSIVHQPNFFVDNIPVILDTSQDLEDPFGDTTKVAHRDVQNEEVQVEERLVEKEFEKIEKETSKKEVEKEKHDDFS